VHELSVAQSLIDLLLERLADQPPARVDVVHLSVGQLSGVDPAALRSAFHVATGATLLRGSRLEIASVTPRVWCVRCNAEREVKSIQSMRCSTCDQPSEDLRAGRELFVERLEVSDA
jgi:hydrogenase nickel incorporation protein HypA/HybF